MDIENVMTMPSTQQTHWVTPNQYCDQLHKAGLILSTREFECVCLRASGASIKETAKILHLSPRTVESHLYNLKVKNNVFSYEEVLKRLRRSGFFYEILCYANNMLDVNS